MGFSKGSAPPKDYSAGAMGEEAPKYIQAKAKYASGHSKVAHERHQKLNKKKVPNPKEGVEHKATQERSRPHSMVPSVNPVITAVGGGPAPMVMSPATAGRENHYVSKKEVMNSTYLFPRVATAMLGLVDPSPSR